MARETAEVALLRPAELGLSGRALRWKRTLVRFARKKPLGAVSAVVLILLFAMALGADILPIQSPIKPAPVDRLQGPSGEHLFGTDQLGRDMLAKTVYGARPSLYTGFVVVALTAVLGMILGISSAYFAGIYDLLVQRVVDGLMSIPPIILAMSLLSVFNRDIDIGPVTVPVIWHGIPVMVAIALVVVFTPSTSRVVRSATFGIKHGVYVEAARAIGCSPARIMVRHLLPNVVSPVIVVASAQLGSVILIEASLAFLGFGAPPPAPSWGGMLQSSGRRFMETAPWLAIFPGLAISLSVLSFNLLGDALRDVLDPRLRRA